MAFSGDVGLLEVTTLQSKLANHRRQQTGAKLLATVLDDRPAIVAVQKQDMATFAFHRVDPYFHAAGTANLTNPSDELPARHVRVVGHLCPTRQRPHPSATFGRKLRFRSSSLKRLDKHDRLLLTKLPSTSTHVLIDGHGVEAPLAMLHVSVTELKSRLGTYLALVRAGETINITSRSQIVARLVPSLEEEPLIEDPIDPPETLRNLDRLPSARSIPARAALLAERRRR